MSPRHAKRYDDQTLIMKGSDVILSVLLPLLLPARVASMKNPEPGTNDNLKRLGGIRSVVSTIGTCSFTFILDEGNIQVTYTWSLVQHRR